MKEIRAFIAIELPDTMKKDLSLIIDSLRPSEYPCVKWVSPRGIHLTLKFLGNIATDLVPRIVDATAQAAQGTRPFKLRVGGLGCFPNLHRPRVIWVAVTGDVEPLITLQRGIDQAVAPLGFAIEKRPFSPHLTLGRLRERASAEELSRIGEIITAAECEAGSATEVNQISLMRSTLTPSGAIYNRLASVDLKE